MKNNGKETKKGESMKGKYLNPKADLTFKLVFGVPPELIAKSLGLSVEEINNL